MTYPATPPPFEITDDQFHWLGEQAKLGHFELGLEQLINAHDFEHRQIVGVLLSLAPFGMNRWHERWQAEKPKHMERARAAYEAARVRHAEARSIAA